MSSNPSAAMQEDAKNYFERKDINLIMESIMTGLVFEQPDDPLTYIEDCVKRLKQATTPSVKPRRVHWDAFIPTDAQETIKKRKERAKILRTNAKVVDVTKPVRPATQGRVVLPPVSAGGSGGVKTRPVSRSKSAKQQTVLLSHPNIIFVLGGPGSGKGTQCERLAKEFKLTHLSTGDLLRAELEHGTDIGRKCDALMREGKIVPMDIILGLLKSAIADNMETPGFLIDGFPRAMDQALEFEKTIGKCRAVLCFTCPLTVLEQRLLERGKTSGRADDNIDTILKRFKTFEEQSMPVIDHFKKDGRAILIESTGTIDEVYQTTKFHLVEMKIGALGKAAAEPLPPITPHKSRPTTTTARGKAWQNIVFVLGGPGCGKGTQCVRIAQEFKYNHLSAGDLLRAEVASGSPRAKELDAIMKEGKIVPMSVTLSLLQEAMEKSGEANGFLIDGFPRQLDQAVAFEETIAQCKFVLMFDCPESVLEQRLLKRGETSGRADDNMETIKKRFRTFVDTSMPVITHFEKLGRCVKISSVPHPEEVYKATRPYFTEPNIIMVLGGPGSGKGTQCVRLAKEFNLTHLSTGDLLRAEVEKGSDIGKQCSKLMEEGKIVPMGIILGLLKTEILSHMDTPGFLIDGFPRAMDQAKEFEHVICPPKKVLFFSCPLNVLEERLLERGKTSGRADDNIETIRKRFKTFQEESLPVVGYFGSKVLAIESTGTIDHIYATVKDSLVTEGILKPADAAPNHDNPPATVRHSVAATPATPATKVERIATAETIAASNRNSVAASARGTSAVTHPAQERIESVAELPPVPEMALQADPNIIFVLGGPGSGKGTQCVRLAKEFHLTHLSTGDLLRAELEKGSDIGKQCGDLMKEGKIVPMDIILGLLKQAILSSDKTPGFLIDGFPRAMDQAIEFEKVIFPAKKVLFFNCPLETLEQRLIERGKTSGRADDNIETIRKRFKTFQEESLPVVGHFGSRVLAIESTGTVDEVYSNLRKSLIDEGVVKADPNIIFVLGGPGSGKGTQCVQLAKEFRLTHLSTGDLLRAELDKGSDIGKKCGDLMKEGKIVPMEIILGLLKDAIDTHEHTPGFLIDGFPRAMDQAIEFEKTICPAKKVLFFNCPLDTLEQRLLERGKTSGRADDNIETIRKRFKTFQEESLPVVGHFGSRVLTIESTKSVNEVYATVRNSLISEGIVKPDPNLIFVLGGPGSGKGTQCVRLAKEFRLTHLSTGDLLRAELDKGSDIGKKCGDLMKEGKIVPMEIILGLLKNAIFANVDTPGFLIDGFPRAMDQAVEFEKTICPAKKVLFFNCPLDTLEARLLERGKTSGRADDNIETIRKRFKTFQEESLPVVGHFGTRVLTIESTKSVDEVYASVKGSLISEGIVKPDPNLIFVLGGPGSGKGTQCVRLAKEFRLTHLSTGDLLRAELDKGSDIGKKCGDLMKEGKIVPMEIILGLLKNAIFANVDTPGFLIDGFPRAMDQAVEFEKTICPAKKVLFFNCPLDTLEQRLLERGKTSGRADDNIETIRKRFKTFQEESLPVVGHFGTRVLTIESTKSVDEVYASVKDSLISEGIVKPDPNLIFVLGGPGSGKGTQCVRLAKEFHLAHLSAGDLLRAELEKGSEIGKKCGDIMKEGKIVPMEIMLGLLKTAIFSNADAPGILVDGFPRAMDQAIEFERTICPAKKVLFFNCPLDTLEERLLERGKTSGRADDNIETIRKRFQTFQNESLPVVGHFGSRVLTIESTGSVDEVYAHVRDALVREKVVRPDPNLIFVLGGPGSGKGTQCVQLAKEFHLTHLSAGDLLRAELEKGSEIGKKCGDIMKEGKIVPMEIMLGLLKKAIFSNVDTPGFLIDGFPRAMDQAIAFEKTICPAKKVLFFNCPLDTLEQRLLERGKTSGRADDNIETIRKRFKTFQEESLPVVGHFGSRVLTIESVGAVEEVYNHTRQCLLDERIVKPIPNIIFVLGGPGSGKGTQCARLAEEFHLRHLSTGDLLRAELEKGTEVGKQCGDLMKEGKIVPMSVILGLLKSAIFSNLDTPGFLIDGFPRASDQALEFEKTICPAKKVLYFSCPLSILEERLLERGKTSGRADDNLETIRKRFKTFEDESLPVVNLFEDRVIRVESTGTVDEVYESVKSSLLSDDTIRSVAV
ncbi:hypothetical protein HDU77_006371 [Chytriomyces hyalinus]|nr:hypothetical protein HDU77_006371 [Chytriomyces hyalinus]